MSIIYSVLLGFSAFLFIICIRFFTSTRFGGIDSWSKKIRSLSARKVFSALLANIGLIIFFYGLYTSSWNIPRFDNIGSWSWSHWLWILALWGILATLIAINAKSLGKAIGTLQTILTIIVLMLFIGFPIIGWFSNIGKPRQHRVVSRQTTSIPIANKPIADEWQKLVIPAGGKLEIPLAPSGMRTIVKGHGANLHVVYRDGHEYMLPIESNESSPKGSIVGVYVTNRTNETNVIYYTYTYAQKDFADTEKTEKHEVQKQTSIPLTNKAIPSSLAVIPPDSVSENVPVPPETHAVRESVPSEPIVVAPPERVLRYAPDSRQYMRSRTYTVRRPVSSRPTIVTPPSRAPRYAPSPTTGYSRQNVRETTQQRRRR